MIARALPWRGVAVLWSAHLKHRIGRAAILAGLLLAAPGPVQATPDLTGDVWAVCGTDPVTTWHETKLVFTAQSGGTKAGVIELSGYFDWRSARGSYGREFFSGTLDANGTVTLQGFALENSLNIVTSRYTGTLTTGGTEIVDGKWYDGVPGLWSAVRKGTTRDAIALCDSQTV